MIFQTWSPDELLTFFLVLVRLSVLIALVPILGDKVIPVPVKIFLSLTFSALLFPFLRETGYVVVSEASEWSQSAGKLVLAVISEVLVGLSLGFASQLVFHAIHAAGDLMSTYMGLSMATQYDPHMGSQTMIISQLLGALAIMTFLALDGHHVLFRAMVESFRLIHLGDFAVTNVYRQNLMTMSGNVLLYGVQLSAPISACMLLVNIVYGVLGKALPQLNVLTLSMAAGVFIGTTILLVSYPAIQSAMANLFNTYFDDLKQFMVAYGGK